MPDRRALAIATLVVLTLSSPVLSTGPLDNTCNTISDNGNGQIDERFV